MSQSQRSPSLGQVLDRLREVTMRRIRVALPVAVQAYDAATQTADVQPLIDDQIQQEDGTYAVLPFPVLTHVPVAFPGGGGFRVTFPLRPGDTGQVLISDLSLDLWKQQGGHVSPKDQRRHHIADAVFYPGMHPDSAAWASAGTASLTMGADAGPQVVCKTGTIELGGTEAAPPGDAVALASLVLSQLGAIVTAFNAHTHPVPGVTAGPGSTTSSAPGTPASSPGSVASAILKAQ